MEWIGWVRCEKSRLDFVAQTFALIAPVHPVMHRVSCCYEMIWNAPKYYATHQNISSRMWRIGFVRCEKSRRDFVARIFALMAPVHTILHRVSCSYETIPNAPKHLATHQNMSLGSNGVDRLCSLQKIPLWLRGTNFFINCTSSPYFASSFIQLWNDPKCTQTLCNARKHEFRVQWGGLGAFVEKNPDVTYWQELSHQLHQFTLFCIEFHVVTKRSQMHPNTKQRTKTWV